MEYGGTTRLASWPNSHQRRAYVAAPANTRKLRSTQSREGKAGLSRTAKNMKSVTMSMKSDAVKTDHIVQMLAAKFINRLAPKRVTRTPCRVFMTPCGLRTKSAPPVAGGTKVLHRHVEERTRNLPEHYRNRNDGSQTINWYWRSPLHLGMEYPSRKTRLIVAFLSAPSELTNPMAAVLESSAEVLTVSPPAPSPPLPINNGIFRSDLLTAYEAVRSPDGLIGKADLVALLIGCVLAAAVLFLALLTWRRTCGRLRLRCQCCLAVGFAAPDDVEGELLCSGWPRSDFEMAAGAPPDWKAPPAVEWSLGGKVALVTGGSKGLGRAIVEELLKHGCEVLTCARDLTPLAALVSSEPRCVAVQADVATAEGRQKLLALIARRYSGNLDILVNNVGTNLRRTSASHEYTDAEYDLVVSTNQSSAFHLTRQCYAALKKRKGSVVNVSSVSGSMVDNTGAPYAVRQEPLERLHADPNRFAPRCSVSRAHRPRGVLARVRLGLADDQGGARADDALPRMRVGSRRRSSQRRRALVHLYAADGALLARQQLPRRREARHAAGPRRRAP